MYTTVKSGYIGFEKHVFFCKLSETFAIKWFFFLYCCFILKQSNVTSVHVSVIQHMQVRCCALLFTIKLQRDPLGCLELGNLSNDLILP